MATGEMKVTVWAKRKESRTLTLASGKKVRVLVVMLRLQCGQRFLDETPYWQWWSYAMQPSPEEKEEIRKMVQDDIIDWWREGEPCDG